MKNLYDRFIQVGQSDQYSKGENTKIEYLNITLIVLSVLLIASLSTNVINQKWSLLFDTLIYSGCSLSIISIFLLHYFKLPKIARLVFFFAPTLVIASACFILKVTFLLELLNIVFLVIFFNYFSNKRIRYFFGAYQLLVYNFVFFLIHFAGIYENVILFRPLDNVIIYDLLYIGLFFIIGFTTNRIEHEIKQKELALKELRSQIEKTEAAYKSMESFAYVISHDIKAPLTNMTAFAALLQDELEEGETKDLKEYTKYIQKEGTKLSTMVDDVLYFAKLNNDNHADKKVHNNIVQMVGDISGYLKTIYPQSEVLVDTSLPSIYGNASNMKILLQNLIENGLKYNKNETPQVNISSYTNGDKLKIIFEDNGIGISQKHQEKIFQLFGRLHTDSEYKGTGVGLANCKKIVENHLNGQLEVESEIGKGAKFVITLPKN